MTIAPSARLWPYQTSFELQRRAVFARSWFRGKEFTTDWSSGNFSLWRRVLWPLRNEPIKVIEIGSWEGRSAIFFLNFFDQSTIACIDTFAGNTEESKVYEGLAGLLPDVEQRFDRNLAPYQNRVEKIKSRSGPALEKLKMAGRRFDLAYIDGSHWRDDVMATRLASGRSSNQAAS